VAANPDIRIRDGSEACVILFIGPSINEDVFLVVIKIKKEPE
jgi:hypothetical protein